jgi:hypothetical protein
MLHPLLSHHLQLHAPQRFAASLPLLQPGVVRAGTKIMG